MRLLLAGRLSCLLEEVGILLSFLSHIAAKITPLIRARVTNGINGLRSTWRATHDAGLGGGLDIELHEGETPRACRRPASYLSGDVP